MSELELQKIIGILRKLGFQFSKGGSLATHVKLKVDFRIHLKRYWTVHGTAKGIYRSSGNSASAKAFEGWLTPLWKSITKGKPYGYLG